MATDPVVAGAQLRRMREEAMVTPDMRPFVGSKDYGLTLEEVVTLSGGQLSKATISKLERGEVASPSLAVVSTLGKIYHLSPNDMAELFGFWQPVIKQAGDDKRVQSFLRTVNFYATKDHQKAELLLNGLSGLMRMVEGFQN